MDYSCCFVRRSCRHRLSVLERRGHRVTAQLIAGRIAVALMLLPAIGAMLGLHAINLAVAGSILIGLGLMVYRTPDAAVVAEGESGPDRRHDLRGDCRRLDLVPLQYRFCDDLPLQPVQRRDL